MATLPSALQQHLETIHRIDELFLKPLAGLKAALDYTVEVYSTLGNVEAQLARTRQDLTAVQDEWREARATLAKVPEQIRQAREERATQLAQVREEHLRQRELLQQETLTHREGLQRDSARMQAQVEADRLALKGIKDEIRVATDQLQAVRAKLKEAASIAV